MRIAWCAAAAAGLALAAAAAPADDKAEAKSKDVDYQVHSGYFERNDSGLKGDASYLALADQKAFDAVFGVGRVLGGKQNFLPKDAFDSKLVAAVVKRGKSVVEYKIEKVTADGGTLYVQYTTAEKGGGGTATFASPLIVSADKGKYTSVVIIENGQKAGTAEVGK
jgi:hypothetical protein